MGTTQTNYCPVDNIVRWRHTADASAKLNKQVSSELTEICDLTPESVEQNLQIESNTRLVEWSDGSFSLAIGDELYAISQEDLINS